MEVEARYDGPAAALPPLVEGHDSDEERDLEAEVEDHSEGSVRTEALQRGQRRAGAEGECDGVCGRGEEDGRAACSERRADALCNLLMLRWARPAALAGWLGRCLRDVIECSDDDESVVDANTEDDEDSCSDANQSPNHRR